MNIVHTINALKYKVRIQKRVTVLAESYFNLMRLSSVGLQ